MTFDKGGILSILANPDKKTGDKENRYLIYRMLQAMYERQTMDEQASGFTKHWNNVGFNGVDAPLLSEVAERSKQYKNLTVKQAFMVAKRLKKYAGQLAGIAAEKQQQKLVPVPACSYCGGGKTGLPV